MEFIPFALPSIGQKEIDEVIDTLRSNWITTGPKTRLFEKNFAEYIGAKYAIAVNSCTAALHLALESVGIGQDDKVITTPYTFTASAETIRYLGADPVLIDIDEVTHNINPREVSKYLQQKKTGENNIKAIIPVHFGGLSCDMDPILAIAGEYDLKIIEDAAHSLPTTYGGKMIGTIGDLTCFSFYATKTITTGEGGMVTTDNDQYADRIRTMRLHGISRDVFDRYTSKNADWYYEVIEPGFKYNMPDIMAAIGIHQLEKAETFRLDREKIAEQYNQAFADMAELILPAKGNNSDLHAWHLYTIKLRLDHLNISRGDFINQMKQQGIGTSVHFIPLHMHPYYQKRYNFKPEDFPVSKRVFDSCVSLPIYPKMTADEINRVINSVKNTIHQNKKSRNINLPND